VVPFFNGIDSGVTEGMNGDRLFVNFGSNLGATEGALNTTFGHGRRSLLSSITGSAKSREEEAGVTVGPPIAAEQVEGGCRDRSRGDVGSNTTMFCKRKDLKRCTLTRIPVQTEIDIAEWEE